MTKSLAWTESYCVEKFLPLLTRWQLINIINSKRISSSSISTELLHPDCIIKKRNPKGYKNELSNNILLLKKMQKNQF